MTDTVILGGARTPFGKLAGSLAGFSGPELGGMAIAGALARCGISGDQVDYVIMGQVILAGAGQVPARKAAVLGGVPLTTPSNAINKACLSGINAIYLAHQMVADGSAEIVVAGGMESMTNAPYLLTNARGGYKYGDGTLHDSMNHAAAAGLAREPQDRVAAQSHERAARAQKDGLFDDEIVPVMIPQRKGEPLAFATDEGIRPDTTVESLGKLRAAFVDGGNVTAGNSSQISDGAAAVVVTSRAVAERLGIAPLAEYVSFGQVAGPDVSLLHQPSNAAKQALAKAGLTVSDVDLFELNEAFAAVAVASTADLGITDEIVNVNGGAIALGHPVGASGTRISLHLALELRRRGGGLGVAALCGGGGQGDALVLRVPAS
jgi:acetyl-CoA C-acetyltransferase